MFKLIVSANWVNFLNLMLFEDFLGKFSDLFTKGTNFFFETTDNFKLNFNYPPQYIYTVCIYTQYIYTVCRVITSFIYFGF
jgi:hypothetical protein